MLGQHRATQRRIPRGRDDEERLTADIVNRRGTGGLTPFWCMELLGSDQSGLQQVHFTATVHLAFDELELGEPAAAITIMTPDALRLRHEPAADCARYDSLRRAV